MKKPNPCHPGIVARSVEIGTVILGDIVMFIHFRCFAMIICE